MITADCNSPSFHPVKLDAAGRVVLPIKLRQRLHVGEGDTLMLWEDQTGVHIRTRADVLKDAQDYVGQFLAPGVSLVDELLQERRDEAGRE